MRLNSHRILLACAFGAVLFLAEYGHRFQPLYHFDTRSGIWAHREHEEENEVFSLDAALHASRSPSGGI